MCIYITNYYSIFLAISYGSIVTSVMSLSSTAVDILFSKEDGKAEINIVGVKAKIREDSTASYIVGVLIVCVLVVCPKILMYSWILAMYSWRSLAFFYGLALLVLIAKIVTKWRKNIKMDVIQLQKSVVSTYASILSVEKNTISSMGVLSLCSIFAIVVLACTMPIANNDGSLSFNESLPHNFYQHYPNGLNGRCICMNISIYHKWQNEYFEDGIVCQKLITKDSDSANRTDVKTTNSTCYDEIFFKKPFDFSVIPLEIFPAVTSCITYDGVKNYLPSLEKNLSIPSHFDEMCDVNIQDMYRPCSNEILIQTKIILSIMIVWMGCSFFVIIMSTMIAYFIAKYALTIIVIITFFVVFGGLIYVLYVYAFWLLIAVVALVGIFGFMALIFAPPKCC